MRTRATELIIGTIGHFDSLIRRDPARRGLISGNSRFGPLCPGHLEKAAADLAESGKQVAIATGFFVPDAPVPAAETDGPLGALLLAAALEAAGIRTTILTDANCLSAICVLAEAADYSVDQIVCCSDDRPDWLPWFFTQGPGALVTHLIAVERVGPSHTPASIANQPGDSKVLTEFTALVAAEHHNRCFNMRGKIIDQHTGELHKLFEEFSRYRPDGHTIGIGDGGNEIGMGTIPWKELCRRLDGDHAPRIPCRIATDWNIIAGTSNWGAYALAASVLLLRGQTELLRRWDGDFQYRLLQRFVQQGPGVDGVSGRQEATVDGLPFLTYIQPWQGMRHTLRF